MAPILTGVQMGTEQGKRPKESRAINHIAGEHPNSLRRLPCHEETNLVIHQNKREKPNTLKKATKDVVLNLKRRSDAHGQRSIKRTEVASERAPAAAAPELVQRVEQVFEHEGAHVKVSRRIA
jgi:hypothetical protein